jgi:hypothetical protein
MGLCAGDLADLEIGHEFLDVGRTSVAGRD